MKNHFTKIISLLFILSMLAGMFSVTSFARDPIYDTERAVPVTIYFDLSQEVIDGVNTEWYEFGCDPLAYIDDEYEYQYMAAKVDGDIDISDKGENDRFSLMAKITVDLFETDYSLPVYESSLDGVSNAILYGDGMVKQQYTVIISTDPDKIVTDFKVTKNTTELTFYVTATMASPEVVAKFKSALQAAYADDQFIGEDYANKYETMSDDADEELGDEIADGSDDAYFDEEDKTVINADGKNVSEETEEKESSTGKIIAIILAVIVIAGGAVFVIKKKKS